MREAGKAKPGMVERSKSALRAAVGKFSGRLALKTSSLVLAGVMIGTGSATAGCVSRPPHERVTVTRENPQPTTPEPRLSVSQSDPGMAKACKSVCKIVCKNMLFVSSGLVVYNPIVDWRPTEPGYPIDLRVIDNEFVENDPQPPGPHQWYTDNGDKISDQDARTNHCQGAELKRVIRHQINPETDTSTYVSADFDADHAPPINHDPSAVKDNPNDYHQVYANVDGMPIPGVSVPTN